MGGKGSKQKNDKNKRQQVLNNDQIINKYLKVIKKDNHKYAEQFHKNSTDLSSYYQ